MAPAQGGVAERIFKKGRCNREKNISTSSYGIGE